MTVNDDRRVGPDGQLGGASYSTAEGDAASVTVRISPRRSSPTAVGLTYSNVSAASGDYTAAPASVTIPANAASHTFTVQTTEDPTVETDETFTLTIGTLPAGVATGSPSSTTVTITDDDTAPTPTVSFAVASYSAAEGAAASVTVRISPTRSAPTAVGLTFADVNAEAGDDYTAAPASVTIPANTGLAHLHHCDHRGHRRRAQRELHPRHRHAARRGRLRQPVLDHRDHHRRRRPAAGAGRHHRARCIVP